MSDKEVRMTLDTQNDNLLMQIFSDKMAELPEIQPMRPEND